MCRRVSPLLVRTVTTALLFKLEAPGASFGVDLSCINPVPNLGRSTISGSRSYGRCGQERDRETANKSERSSVELASKHGPAVGKEHHCSYSAPQPLSGAQHLKAPSRGGGAILDRACTIGRQECPLRPSPRSQRRQSVLARSHLSAHREGDRHRAPPRFVCH